MKEYIERAAVLKSLGYEENRRGDVLPGSTFDIILKAPAADVVEVRHGRWKNGGNGLYDTCTACGEEIYLAIPMNYCPLCGARMGKEDEHGD